MAWSAKDFEEKTKWTADDFKEKKSSFTPTVSSPPKIFNRDLKTPTPTVAPTPQPIQSNFIDSYLKPFQPSNNADVPIGAPFQVNPDNKPLPAVENLSFTPVKKYGHAITPDNKGLIMPGPVTRKEGPQYNNAPLEIVGETDNAYVYQMNGYLQTIPKSMVTDSQIKDVNEMNSRYKQIIEDTELARQQRRENEYAAKNPIDRFFTKATDIGFRQDDKTPSLGNPVADVASNIVGGIMGLATPTGGGQSLGGAMNTAGDLVEYGVNKWGGKLINKLPNVVQKIAPRMVKEVGEGLVYSASKAPDYTGKDWAQNALEDATLGTGLGLLMDGAKNIPDIVKKAQDNSKSKAIDKAYDALKTDMFNTDGVKTQRPTNTEFNTALRNISPIKEPISKEPVKPISDPVKPIKDPVKIKPFEVNKQTLPMEERTLSNIGSKKVNAYQYDNPQVKNEIQAYAGYIKDNELLSGPNKIESTSPVMKKLKEVTKASYAEIDKALNSIIKNQGAENYATAKRVEMVIDDMLTNGFENIKGEKWGADKAYLAKKSLIEGKPIKSVNPDSKYLNGEELPLKDNTITNPKPLKNPKLEKLDSDYKQQVDYIKNNKVMDSELKAKRLKALGMQHSADKRQLIQGDSLDLIEGGLTHKELQSKKKYLDSNYVGKKVIVDGKEGIITGNPFGKVTVKFEDGTTKTVLKDAISKYNPEIETKIKTAKPNEQIGTLGDYLQGEQVRELYKPVLDTPIKVTDQKAIVNGALGEVNGKPTILVNKNTPNIEDTILEEASHAMRETKGRTNLGLSGIDEAKAGQYETLTYEKSADKMVKHAKSLDNPKLEGQSGMKKDLKLTQSVKGSDQFNKKVKSKVKGDYEVKNNSQLMRDAEALIKTDLERAKRLVKDDNVNTDMSNEVARQLIQKAQKEGKFDEAIEFVEITSKKAMESGRAVQALSLWSKMTPEGMLKYAQNMIDKANAKFAKMNPKEFNKIKAEYKKQGIDIKYFSLNPMQSKMAKIIQLTSADAQYINKQMTKINNMADGRPKDIEIAKVLDYIAAKIPPSTLQQISTLQTMAHLLNAKTAIRNTLGNAGFQVLENLSDTLGTPIDKFIGTVTKERTKFLPSLKTQALGMKKGFSLGLEDALLGIDTSGISTQMDLPNRTFRKGFWGGLEKIMNIELRATDRAFYQSAFDQSLRNQILAKKISYDKVTSEMIEQAHLDGLYKTFQDKNVLSTAFSNLKRTLNGGKEFGLGDIIMKYPKTPANLLMRGIDYSPLGMVKETFNLAKHGFNQKRFVESLSRAATGTGLLFTGLTLYNLGIMQGKKSSDKEAAELMRETGVDQYTINLSALRRFAMSGLNPNYAKKQEGDLMVNYDWIQPAALPITVGTNIAQQKKGNKNVNAGDLLGATVYSMSAGIDTLAEQPLVQNFAKMFRGYDIKESSVNVVKDIPASFVPTFVNQVRQLVDNKSRDSYSKEAYGFKEALNRVLYKIPGASSKLPERVTTTGKTRETYQDGSNDIFNVFLNPAFVTKYKSSPGTQLILDIYDATGDTKQFPRTVSKTISINGEKYTLSKDEINDLQKEIGTNVMKQIDLIPHNGDKDKTAELIVKILDNEGDKARNKFKRKKINQNK